MTPPAAAMIKSEPLPQLPVDPALPDNAPTTVDADVLLANDLDIVKLYHRLAHRHDELVDWVIEQLRRQAK